MDYKAEWRIRMRTWAIGLLGSKCAVCSIENELEFDHIDASTKEFAISVGIRDGYSKERLLLELEKCQLLCKFHNHEKAIALSEHAGGHNKIVNPIHGTAVMYAKPFRCRCLLCKRWKKDYRAYLVDSQGHLRP